MVVSSTVAQGFLGIFVKVPIMYRDMLIDLLALVTYAH